MKTLPGTGPLLFVAVWTAGCSPAPPMEPLPTDARPDVARTFLNAVEEAFPLLHVDTPLSVSAERRAGPELVEMEVRDVVPLQDLGTHAVMLVAKEGGAILPIFVSEEAAVSIAFQLAKQKPPHPLSGDLLDTVVAKLGGKVTEIHIDDVHDDVFTGSILLRQGRRDVRLEARPSDAIGLALRGAARIYASEKVMARGGIGREEIDELRRSMPGVGGSGASRLPPGHPPVTSPHGRSRGATGAEDFSL